ncbi:c-type cytochrome [Halochromatium glycolicum]|nr:c-type cytochrome [Halochromatium glycolicum]
MSVSSRTLTPFSAAALLGPFLLPLWAPQAIAETGNAESQAQQGEQIAEQICTTCHRVPDEGGAPVGPEFGKLAERSDWTAPQLQQILNTEQHEEAVPASKLQLEAVASYLNQLDD